MATPYEVVELSPSDQDPESNIRQDRRRDHVLVRGAVTFLVVAAVLVAVAGFNLRPAMANMTNVVVLDEDLPKEMVQGAMKFLEDNYNNDEMVAATSIYAESTEVTVSTVGDKPFTSTKPKQVASFLDNLRNKMGGTNLKFTITKVEGNTHTDTWTSDAGKGSCVATWGQDASGQWRIVKDEISFEPKVPVEPQPEEEEPKPFEGEPVPRDVVEQEIGWFEGHFHDNEMRQAATMYAEKTLVTVNGGIEQGGPFTGHTPQKVSLYLNSIRNQMGGKDMTFSVTEVHDDWHKATWTSAAGKMKTVSTWAKDDSGNWKIVKEAITFRPKEWE